MIPFDMGDRGSAPGETRGIIHAEEGDVVRELVAVLGEVPQPELCLAGLRRILRPGALLSITEHLPDPDFSRLSRLRPFVEGEGFVFREQFGRPWSYTANFGRPE